MISGLLISVFVSTASQAPAGSPPGRVVDAAGAPLPGAEVVVVCGQQRQTVVTDATGRFQFTQVPPERCLVIASMDGFMTARQSADFSRAVAPSLSFRLGVRPFSSQVVVTPARAEEETSRVPQGATVVDRADLDVRPYTIVTQALKEEAGVLAQQTTASQGSPIVRGFTGQRNLYLVDGVRLNTAAWRDGPSQYVAWLPGADLDRIEIVRGPGSAQYGSDSLGGTIALFSASPRMQGASRVGGDAGVSFGSANRLLGADASMSAHRGRVSGRAGVAFAAVSDLRPGGGIDSHSAVTRFLGVTAGGSATRLEHTGYAQRAWHARGRLDTGASRSVTASYRHAAQQDAHRYDQEIGGNGRYLSEFRPQALDFGFVRFEALRTGWFDTVSAAISVNRQDDGRREQQRPGARIDEQSNTTTAIGYQVQTTRAVASYSIATIGAELYDERMAGERWFYEPNGSVAASRPDIPDGTRYRTASAFWQHSIDLLSGRVNLRGGARYARFAFRTRADAPLGVAAERITSGDATFNAAAVVVLRPSLNVTGSVSRGVRAANAFDFGGIGLSGGAGFEISPGRAAALGGVRGTTDGATAVSTGQAILSLSPEAALAYEGGLRWHSGRASAALTLFDLEFHDAIERRTVIFPSDVVGRDISGFVIVRQDAAGRAFIAADARPLVTRVNVNHLRVRGFEGEARVRIGAGWRARTWASAASGREVERGAFARRMPPALGGAAVMFQRPDSSWWIEGTILAAARQDRLSDGDIGDARIGALRTPASIAAFFNGTAIDRGLVRDGRLVQTGETLADVQARVLGGAASLPMFTNTPGFAVIGLRAGAAMGSHADLIVIGDNIADRNYRLHGSGVDEPGVNLQVRLRVRF